MLFQNNSISYKDYHEKGCDILNELGYVGTVYRTANFWNDVVKLDALDEIKYLEIGAFHGANALSFWKSYCKDKKAEIHLIDPWLSYSDYNEYQDKQHSNYKKFLDNLCSVPESALSSFYIHRGFSYDKLLTLQNDFFDVIYIDGNHKPEYVMEDAVLSFRKLKKNGYMIFDDYGWEDVNVGVDNFVNTYKEKVKVLACQNSQVFIQKIIGSE